MKYLLPAFALLLTGAASAADLPVVAQPDLKAPLPAEWSVQKGTWEVKDGEMSIAEIPADKHAAVLWHKVPLQSGVVECEFKFDGARVFILGCDGDRHIGRVVITPKSMQIRDDSTEVKGKSPSTLLAEAKFDLKPGQWYPLRYEWSGDRMAAKVGDLGSIDATNPNLGKKKARWWFAVSGAKMSVRAVKVAGAP
ncbi:MAG: hypothetical protein U0984_13125 [Prosthecobacter sp.]|nr:hypothetical protein [Prosthecobacter sp.]